MIVQPGVRLQRGLPGAQHTTACRGKDRYGEPTGICVQISAGAGRIQLTGQDGRSVAPAAMTTRRALARRPVARVSSKRPARGDRVGDEGLLYISREMRGEPLAVGDECGPAGTGSRSRP